MRGQGLLQLRHRLTLAGQGAPHLRHGGRVKLGLRSVRRLTLHLPVNRIVQNSRGNRIPLHIHPLQQIHTLPVPAFQAGHPAPGLVGSHGS